VDDAGVGLAVVGVDDHVDPADLPLEHRIRDGPPVFDLDVIEGAGSRDEVLVEASDLAEVTGESSLDGGLRRTPGA
jgi:hypothetical protein